MKKLLFICPIAVGGIIGAELSNANPPQPVYSLSMLKEKGVYLTCSDSITAGCTGCTMSGQRTESGGTSTYQFNGSNGSGMTFSCKFKDPSAGNLQVGDTLIPTTIKYKVCGTNYSLRLDATTAFTISNDTVRIDYVDCILPLNGTSGSISIKFIQ